jgi:hypothetical protein
MPRTVTIDRVAVTRVQLLKDANGNLQIYAEYQWKAGNQVIESFHSDVTARLSGANKAAALAALDAIATELAAAELAG